MEETKKSMEAFYRTKYGVFNLYYKGRVNAKKEPDPILTVMLSKTSLFCLNDTNSFRKALVWFINWKGFDTAITVAILLNSVMLASTDYETRLNPYWESSWTPIQEKIDLGFSAIFIFECVCKVIAMGFVFNSRSYLRDPWNCLDFFIVSISIISMLPISGGAGSLKALRTFRILRPLRSINKLPAMRAQI